MKVILRRIREWKFPSEMESVEKGKVPPSTSHTKWSQGPSPLGIDLRNLGPLQPNPRHESLLVEIECIDVVRGGCTRECTGKSGVHHHEAWAYADLPTFALVKVLKSFLLNKKPCIAKGLYASLQSVR